MSATYGAGNQWRLVKIITFGVAEIPLDLQPKLLCALPEGEIRGLDGSRTLRINARLIAASNRDLGVTVCEQTFHSDQYYRCNYSVRQKIRKSSLGSYPHSWISDNGLDTPGAVEAEHFQRNQANYA